MASAGPSRSRSLLSSTLKARNPVLSRSYAQEAPVRGFVKPKFEPKRVKMKENTMMFRPLGINGLTHPVFESDSRTALQLPTFHSKYTSREKVGTPVVFDSKPGDPHQAFGLPKRLLLEFRLLSRPASVIRSVTVDTVEKLKVASIESSKKARFVLTGTEGCGKSVLLIQAVEYCKTQDWVVLYIPRASKLVDSSTQYTYDPRTRTYVQAVFSQQTLLRMRKANEKAFSELKTSQPWTFSETIKAAEGASLNDLVAFAQKDPTLAPAVFEAVMTELESQTKYPVLFAVDDFQSLYCKTKERDPHFAGINSYHLSLPRMIMEYASGRKNFKRGAFLGALNASDAMWPIPLELIDTLDLPSSQHLSPYHKRSKNLLNYAEGLQKIEVPSSFSISEAAGVFGVWKDDKAILSRAYDETFMAKFAESGGNPRAFVWNGLLKSLES